MKNIENLYSSPYSSDYSDKSSNTRFQKFFEHIPNACNLRILDYGCGPGNMVDWMMSHAICPKEYFGYDIRQETIEYARKRFPNVNFDSKLPTHNFDVAILCGTISYAYDADVHLCKTQYFEEISKALHLVSPNGFVYGTARKIGHEFSKNGNAMITYSKEELFGMGSCDVYDLLEQEWLFKFSSSSK